MPLWTPRSRRSCSPPPSSARAPLTLSLVLRRLPTRRPENGVDSEAGGSKDSESLVLRARFGQATTSRQGNRTVEATPSIQEDGSILVDLRVMNAPAKGESEMLATQIRVDKGETAIVMGTTKKQRRNVSERLMFLTVDPR